MKGRRGSSKHSRAHVSGLFTAVCSAGPHKNKQCWRGVQGVHGGGGEEGEDDRHTQDVCGGGGRPSHSSAVRGTRRVHPPFPRPGLPHNSRAGVPPGSRTGGRPVLSHGARAWLHGKHIASIAEGSVKMPTHATLPQRQTVRKTGVVFLKEITQYEKILYLYQTGPPRDAPPAHAVSAAVSSSSSSVLHHWCGLLLAPAMMAVTGAAVMPHWFEPRSSLT